MRSSTSHQIALLALLVALACASWAGSAWGDQPTAEQIEFFEKRIRPVLVKHCYQCHSAAAKKVGGQLLLDTRDGLRQGGESGKAVVPGDQANSLLLEALRYESLEMPPTGKLPPEVIRDFEQWIERGAADPREQASSSQPERRIDWDSARQFWSFRPPTRHALPEIDDPQWPRRPLDFFVGRRLQEAGLQPAAEADRRTLLRRLSFDLTGLPPTTEEVEAFVNDRSEIAYQRAVDRLLASPHYGERWVRRWLDVARYAEDQAHIVGNDSSLFYPNAYLYRDWVIRAFNGDMPYDEFLRQQIAADLLPNENSTNLAALGLIGLGPKYYQRNALSVMADEWEDRVDVITRGLLGLTVACARCHDHKYDPIYSEDYYALAGVFASTSMYNRPLNEKAETSKDGQAKSPGDALHIVRDKQPKDLPVYVRGNVDTPGPPAQRRFLPILCQQDPVPFTQGSGRLELAQAIASGQNPLTARVLVNRVWLHLLGQALVTTPSNFGKLGDRPSHPELLDDLAVRFMEQGWSVKWLIREIVTSATYRQDSATTPQKQALDPSNRLLSHANRRRLDVEAWRDSLLAAAGNLERRVGGPSIDAQDPQSRRRTVYSKISRLDLNPMLALFDFPDPNVHAAGRVKTTTPLQKLFVMNSAFMVRRADELAQLVLSQAGPNDAADEARMELIYRRLFSRGPSDREMELGLLFVRQAGRDAQQLWRQYAQVLLASNEIQFLD